MRQAVSRELYEYWDRLRAGRAAPDRSQIDPAQIRGVLADTFLLEVDPERSFPIRLSGARTSALFGTELKGSRFMHLWAEKDRVAVNQMLACIIDEPAPAVAGVTAAPAGRTPLDLELLLLPLRHHGKTHARILGSLAPANIPSWFGLIPAETLGLSSLRILADPGLRKVAGLFAPGRAAAHSGTGPRISRHGHLTLYENPAINSAPR